MKAIILCGGRGTRAYPYTEHLPKPMIPVGGTPILLHVIQIFAEQGFTEIVLAVGHLKNVIIDYFEHKRLDVTIEIVDTGELADTGDRVFGCRHLLREPFFVTYADGLSDVPLDRLVSFHDSHQGLVTVTSVPLVSQYGTVQMDGDGCVSEFREKPTLREHWINAGFLVFDPAVFDRWEGHNLERDVLPALARQGQVFGYKHHGFFKSMDTYKDHLDIEQMCQSGSMPWKSSRSSRSTSVV
jgi:glucose-1-phosphate cytidylyltransferase